MLFFPLGEGFARFAGNGGAASLITYYLLPVTSLPALSGNGGAASLITYYLLTVTSLPALSGNGGTTSHS